MRRPLRYGSPSRAFLFLLAHVLAFLLVISPLFALAKPAQLGLYLGVCLVMLSYLRRD